MNNMLNAAAAGMRLGGVYARAQAKLRHAATVSIAGFVAAVCIFVALLWFDAALWFYCVPRLGPANAALICGGAFVLVASVAVLVIALARPVATRSVDNCVPANAMAASALHELNGFVAEHKGIILVAAALAGVIFGSQPTRRP